MSMSHEPYLAVENLFPISRYAQMMHLDLGHIMQVGGANYPQQPTCSQCWMNWHRQQLRQAIATAEGMIAEQIGYPVAPAFCIEDQRFPWHYRWSAEYSGLWRGQIGRRAWPTLHTRQKRLLTLGTIELTSLDFTANWDCDEAGVNTLLRIVIADASLAIDIQRIRVFHLDDSGNPWQEIRGLSIRRVAGNIVIEGARPFWVLPDACGLGDNCVDWAEDDNFVSVAGLYDADIEVYEEQDHREDAVCFLWTVDETGCTCEAEEQRACARIVDTFGGAIEAEPGVWDGTTLTPTVAAKCYPPDRVTIAYRAGARDPLRHPRYWSYVDGADVRSLRQTDPFGSRMAEAIVRLANSLLPDDARCGCAYATQIWKRDKMLVGYGSATATTSDSRPTIEESQRCPFGPSYGALQAWRTIKPMMAGGVVVG